MLHLIFSADGIERIRAILRPTDQVVQFSKSGIVLIDTAHYLSQRALTGTTIDQSTLARLINNATAIKGTY